MIIAVRHADASECPPAIVRSIEAGVEHVNRVGVLWIGIDARVIPCPLAEISLLICLRPVLAAVVRSKHTAVFGFDNRPDAIRISRRNRDAHDSDRSARQARTARDFSPGIAAISRLEDLAPRTATLQSPRLAIYFPERCVDNVRIGWIDNQIAGAGFVAAEKNFLPGLAAIFRSKYAALFVRRPHMSLRRDVNDIRILRMDANARNLSRVFQADVLPGLAAVRRFVNSIAVRNVAANRRLAHADIDRVRIGIRQTDRAYRSRSEDRPVSDWLPIDAAVARLPNTATGAAEIENHRLRRHPGNRGHATAAKRSNRSPLKSLQRIAA